MSTVQPAATACQSFPDSQTYRCLRTACLGEMHARRLYLHAAWRMEEVPLHVIAHAFRFTAAQEKEHADVFYGLIAAHGGHTASLTEDAPLLLPHEPLDILKAVSQSEHDEWDKIYPYYARVAAEEGYPRIAEAFRRIAENEQHHAMRFLQYAKALADGNLFRDSKRVSWLCLPCGQFHTGCEAPEVCSGCGKSRDHFIRSSFYPFAIDK